MYARSDWPTGVPAVYPPDSVRGWPLPRLRPRRSPSRRAVAARRRFWRVGGHARVLSSGAAHTLIIDLRLPAGAEPCSSPSLYSAGVLLALPFGTPFAAAVFVPMLCCGCGADYRLTAAGLARWSCRVRRLRRMASHRSRSWSGPGGFVALPLLYPCAPALLGQINHRGCPGAGHGWAGRQPLAGVARRSASLKLTPLRSSAPLVLRGAGRAIASATSRAAGGRAVARMTAHLLVGGTFRRGRISDSRRARPLADGRWPGRGMLGERAVWGARCWCRDADRGRPWHRRPPPRGAELPALTLVVGSRRRPVRVCTTCFVCAAAGRARHGRSRPEDRRVGPRAVSCSAPRSDHALPP